MHRDALVAACLGLVVHGCATGSGPRAEPAEEALSLSVESVEVLRGRLRFSAAMEEASPDVSVWLDPPCERREVGGGTSTGQRLVWLMSSSDLGAALRCGLRVESRGGGRLLVASVGVDLTPQAVEGSAPSVSRAEDQAELTFGGIDGDVNLLVGDSLLPTSAENNATFLVSYDDLARAALGLGAFRLYGTSIDGVTIAAKLAVGGVVPEEAPGPESGGQGEVEDREEEGDG